MVQTELEASGVFDRSSTSRAPRIWQLCLVLTVAGLFSLTSGTSLAFAQMGQNDDGLPSAILLATHVQRGKPVAELDKQIRKAVVEHAPVHLLEGAAKKLSALQAGARCRDESVACLRSVAKLAGVEVLLGATLERGAGELTLSFMAFDARADAVTRVAHWQDGSDVTAETYAALPNLLAALFPEPGPPDMDFVAEANAGGGTPDPTARPLDMATSGNLRPSEISLLGPILVASGGALLLGAGVVTGVMLNSTQNDYSDKQVLTRADAERADALRSRASTEASLANVFYGLGSVALVASSAWLAVELWGSGNKQEHASATTLAPWIAPRQLGLVLRHEGGVF